jgi:hypothetical protein
MIGLEVKHQEFGVVTVVSEPYYHRGIAATVVVVLTKDGYFREVSIARIQEV